MLNIEVNYSIDCFIHKFGYLFPIIPEYLLFFGRASLEFEVDKNGEVKASYQKCNEYFQSLLEFYDIEKKRIDISDIMKMNGAINIILPCDSYNFEYCTQNYMSYHLEHNILIKGRENNQFYVFDDNPAYNGTLSQDVILASYSYKQGEIYQYVRNDNSEKKDSLAFFYKNAMDYQIDLYHFLCKLLDNQCDPQKILLSLEELRITFKRYRSLILICKSINKKFPGIADGCLAAAFKFEDELTLITNLASIGLRNSERYIKRVRNRLDNLRIYETELNGEYAILIRGLVNYNVAI